MDKEGIWYMTLSRSANTAEEGLVSCALRDCRVYGFSLGNCKVLCRCGYGEKDRFERRCLGNARFGKFLFGSQLLREKANEYFKSIYG